MATFLRSNCSSEFFRSKFFQKDLEDWTEVEPTLSAEEVEEEAEASFLVSRTEKERRRDHLLLFVAVLSLSFSLSFSFSFSFSFFFSFFERDVSSTCSNDPDSVPEDGEAFLASSSAMALILALAPLFFLSFLSFFHEKSADRPFFSFLGEVADRGEVSGEEASAGGSVREGGMGASLIGLGVGLAAAASVPSVVARVDEGVDTEIWFEGVVVELDKAALEPAPPTDPSSPRPRLSAISEKMG